MKARATDRLFTRFDPALTDRGYLAMGGQIIDATGVPAPKQRGHSGGEGSDQERADLQEFKAEHTLRV